VDKYAGETPDPRNPQMNRPGDVSPKTLGMMPTVPSKPGGDQNAGTVIGPGSRSWSAGKASALAHESISVAGKGAKPPTRR
jgi:hypothetical protein